MFRKFLVLFLGVLFLAPFEGKAVEYQCYDPIRKKTLGPLGGKVGYGEKEIAEGCGDKYPECQNGKCTLPPKK